MQFFGVSRFKSFYAKQKIPVKPLTLIYGANSAGKSSIIQGFLLLDTMMRTGLCDAQEIQTAWDKLDLGGFKQFSYKHDYEEEIAFALALENNILLQLSMKAKTNDIGQLTDEPAFINAIHILIDNTREYILKFSKNTADNNAVYKLSKFNNSNQQWVDYYEKISGKPIEECTVDSATVSLATFDFYTFANSHAPGRYDSSAFKSCFDIPVSYLSDDLRIFIDFMTELINSIWTPVWKPLSRSWHHIGQSVVNYIGPLRDYPPRVISNEMPYDKMKDRTWSILLRDENVRKKVNKWFGNPKYMDPTYRFDVEKRVDPNEIILPLLELISEIDIENGIVPEELESLINIQMGYDQLMPSSKISMLDPDDEDSYQKLVNNLLKIIKKKKSIYEKLQLIDERSKVSVSLRDVGVGISQVLPVLVNAYSPDNNVVAIEQPEIHLHPKLQSELADVFIETALGEEKKTYLIETHSEHLILRIMRRIRETTSGDLPLGKTRIKPEDVQILFVRPSENGEGSIVETIQLDYDGELIDEWPGGFFEEGYRDRYGLS